METIYIEYFKQNFYILKCSWVWAMKYETFAIVMYLIKLWMLQGCQCSRGDTSVKCFLEFLTVITVTSVPHSALWSRAVAVLFLGGAKMLCCLLGFALHFSHLVWEAQMRGLTILWHLIPVAATHSGSTSGNGSPWSSTTSFSVHKHVRLSPLAEKWRWSEGT